MHYFVVAGILSCRKFSQVLSITEYLGEKYPYIIFQKVFVKHYNWKEWLHSLTKNNGWNHFSLPIIWKEIPFRGGKKCLIGGYHKFMEYCSEMFHVEITFTPTNMEFSGFRRLIKEIQGEEELRARDVMPRRVCIYGAGSVLVPLFVPMLLNISGLATWTGLTIGLYDEEISKKELLEDIVKEFGCIAPQDSCSKYFSAYTISNIFTATKNCDLFILIIPEFRLKNAFKECWSQSVSYAARAGHSLATQAKENIRIILVSESNDTPICLCAAAFAQAAMPNVLSQNIVAVTGNIGIITRSMLANSLELPLHLVKEVPIWGFVGVSHLLDPSLDTSDDENFTHSEIVQKFQSDPLFKSEYLTSYLWPQHRKRQETEEILLGRKPNWPTVEAMMDILHRWYSADSSEKTAFLGIHSDGTFGIPPGIYFSQPAILAGGIWRPNGEYSQPTDQFCTIDSLSSTAVLLTETYLKKEKCRYRLTGLDVETNEDYFLKGTDEKVKDKLHSTSCEDTVNREDNETHPHRQDYYYIVDIVKSTMKELIKNILSSTQYEHIIPCIFHSEENYDLVTALIREMMHQVLHEKQLNMLIPCLFSTDDDTNFVIAFIQESMRKILTDMKLETLIPCIIPQGDTNFIIDTMKQLVYRSLADLNQQELMPCIFPWTDNEYFVMGLMKELMNKTLSDLQLNLLLPYLFPYFYIKEGSNPHRIEENPSA